MMLLLACHTAATPKPDPDPEPTVGGPEDADGVLLGVAAGDQFGWALHPSGAALLVEGYAVWSVVEDAQVTATILPSYGQFTFGDHDGDGAEDLASFGGWKSEDCYFNVTIDVYRGPFVGTVDEAVTRYSGTSTRCSDPPQGGFVGDIDGDGADDLLFAVDNFGLEKLPVVTGDTGESTPWIPVTGSVRPGAAGDLDGDGVADLLLLSQDFRDTQVFLGPVVAGTRDADATLPPMWSAAVGDLDGDGVDDVLGGDFDTLSAVGLDGEAFATFPNLDRDLTPAVAIGAGPRLILGSSGAVSDLTGPFAGAVEVSPTWVSDDATFGQAVALAGDRLYVGARGWTDDWSEQGAVFWFE